MIEIPESNSTESHYLKLPSEPALSMVWVFVVIIALVIGLFVGAYLKMTILC